MDTPAEKKPRWTHIHTAALMAALPILNFAAAAFHGGWDGRFAFAAILLSLSSGLLGGLLHYAGGYAWLTSVMMGLLLTLFSEIGTLAGPPYSGETLVSFLSSVFYFSLFLSIGGVAELIRAIHHALHFRDDRV